MEIIEGNKLIAEFMGMKHYAYFPHTQNCFMMEDGHLIQYHDLVYHSSWDALMLVAEKISNNFNVTISSLVVWSCRISKIGLSDEWVSFGQEKPILNVWVAIVKFIDWYNQL